MFVVNILENIDNQPPCQELQPPHDPASRYVVGTDFHQHPIADNHLQPTPRLATIDQLAAPARENDGAVVQLHAVEIAAVNLEHAALDSYSFSLHRTRAHAKPPCGSIPVFPQNRLFFEATTAGVIGGSLLGDNRGRRL